jgi:glycosyltransferase involved in cell wall biosynthesis
MRILYAAIDQTVPGTTGGSIHVAAVAEGLVRLGHDVHVAAMEGDGPFPGGAVTWHHERPPLDVRQLRWLRAGRLTALARRLQPDVVIERYYNFGGEGLRAARRVGAAAVLEVNAPVVDHPGSLKRTIDRALVGEPMRRWREWQCRHADLIVVPSAQIVPAWVPRVRILEVEWGADTDRFRPGARGPVPFERAGGETVAVFAGAFRAWHGAIHLVEAMDRLWNRGRRDIRAVLIGDGPELKRVGRAAARLPSITLTGALPHERLPACLAAADVGVAPFDPAAHPPLSLAFYWSPLKVFEYMAAGLPVVAPAIDRLRTLVRHGREGLLYDGPAAEGIADALVALSDPARRAALGAAARTRAETAFSWRAHCEALDAALGRLRRSAIPCVS